jgi:L-arabinose isomerase
MLAKKIYKFFVAAATQWLYGEEALKIVQEHMQEVNKQLREYFSGRGIQAELVLYPVGANQEAFEEFFSDAEYDKNCAGVILWPHTFSPSQLSMKVIKKFSKAICVLHTNYMEDVKWDEVNMDFMNLNQTAHGFLEFIYGCMRAGKSAIKVIGNWQNQSFKDEVAEFIKVASACHGLHSLKIVSFSDKMRYVGSTETDRNRLLLSLGVTVLPYDINDLTDAITRVLDEDPRIAEKIGELEKTCFLQDELREGGTKRQSLIEAVRIYWGIKSFLEKLGAEAFTTNFEALGTLEQLPGLAVQLLMEEGYGFAAEGDVKTAATVWLMLRITDRTTFMEHYIADHASDKMLGAHMLEVARVDEQKVKIEIHPLGIGGKTDPVRAVFGCGGDKALLVTLTDVGNRFRFVASALDLVPGPNTPSLPVARFFWKPEAGLAADADCWTAAMAYHHGALSVGVRFETMLMISDIMDIEMMIIKRDTNIVDFRQALRANAAYYGLKALGQSLIV